jgi:hypothetical protein
MGNKKSLSSKTTNTKKNKKSPLTSTTSTASKASITYIPDVTETFVTITSSSTRSFEFISKTTSTQTYGATVTVTSTTFSTKSAVGMKTSSVAEMPEKSVKTTSTVFTDPWKTYEYTPYVSPTGNPNGHVDSWSDAGWRSLGEGGQAGVVIGAAIMVVVVTMVVVWALDRCGPARANSTDDFELGRSLSNHDIEEPLTSPRSTRRGSFWRPMLPTIDEANSTSPSVGTGARNSVQGCIDRAVSVLTGSSSGGTRPPKIFHSPPSPTISMHELNAVGGDSAPLPPQDFISVYTLPFGHEKLPALPDSPTASKDTSGSGEEFVTATSNTENSESGFSTTSDSGSSAPEPVAQLRGFPMDHPYWDNNKFPTTPRNSDVIRIP